MGCISSKTETFEQIPKSRFTVNMKNRHLTDNHVHRQIHNSDDVILHIPRTNSDIIIEKHDMNDNVYHTRVVNSTGLIHDRDVYDTFTVHND